MGKVQFDGHPVTPEYGALIENTDWNIGRILQTVQQLNLGKNTIIILTSDNGGIYSLSHQQNMRAGKGSYYEGGLRVPMVWKWGDKWKANNHIEDRITQMDFLPTLLSLTKSKAPKKYIMNGQNFSMLFEGRKFHRKHPIFYHFPIYLEAYNPGHDGARDPLFRTRPGTIMIDGDYKLHYYYEDHGFELYNLSTDPMESDNLAQEQPKRVNKMYNQMKKWLKSVNAQIPTKHNPSYDVQKEKKYLNKVYKRK